MTESLISINGLQVGYDGTTVCRDVDLAVPAGSYTAIIGPNACGKSTLLRAVARLLPLKAGSVILSGRDISTIPTRAIARELGLLPQSSTAPEGIIVSDLVGRGRYPHQRMFDRWSREDEKAVTEALEATATTDLADRLVDELSGGQRQRVWLAMVLAQQTPILLLDEPTTFLDIAHQYGLLELFDSLRSDHGRTIVVVLHDLNQAARYADHLIVMKDGSVVASGDPAEVITAELVESVYGLRCRVEPDPETGAPMVIARAGRCVA
ncbi:ABC transporter ATP-binding protein [Gordonia malaquae]|uniref:ABC transporter ATP-binding protein n=1 Tax=Gordonia malaquae TaxID=410332 RepID=UPI0030C78E82